ncbi:MAG: sulfatase, partial [Pirellulales bacterium]
MTSRSEVPALAVLDPVETDAARPAAGVQRPAATRRTAAPVPDLRPADVLRLALCLALLTGLLEAAHWAFRRHVLGEFIAQGHGYLWMAPAAQLAVLALPALGLAWLAGRRPQPALLSLVVTLLAFVGWFNLVLLVPKLHTMAQAMLALGLAAATGRLAERRGRTVLAAVRRGAVGLPVAVALIAAVVEGRAWQTERAALSALPAPPRSAPNVVLIVLDTVRADALGLHGRGGDASPNLDRLAAGGVVFEQALSTAPWTLPAHAGMFTGLLPHELSCDWSLPLDGRQATLAEWLAARGYETAGFVANTRYTSRETGLARGFAHYEDYGHSWGEFALCTALGRKLLMSNVPARCGHANWPGRKTADRLNADFLSWLDQREERPYFAFLNYWDAHDPYVPPAGGRQTLQSVEQRLAISHWWWIDKLKLSPELITLARQSYHDCIRYLDLRLGQLFFELDHRGELENTLVIITSDHGEHFGEHGLFLHGNSLYQPVLHVPLIVIGPGVAGGVRVPDAVSLADIPATVATMLEDGSRHPFAGRSLLNAVPSSGGEAVPVISQIATPSRYPPDHGRSPVAGGPMQSITLEGMKYIRQGDGVELLYRLDADPREEHDL